MNQLAALSLACLVLACSARTEPTPTSSKEPRMTAQGTLLYTLQYVPGARWIPDAPVEQQPLGPHFDYAKAQLAAGALVANGPFLDAIRGLYVVRAGTEAEARAFAERDPAITSGVMVVDRIEPWFVMFDGFAAVVARDSRFFELVYAPGESWVEGRPLTEQAIGPHVEYMTQLFQNRVMIAGGPLPGTDRGRYLIATQDAAAAERIVAADPGLASGLFSVTSHPWLPMQRQSIADASERAGSTSGR